MNSLLKVVSPILVLALGIGTMVVLTKTKPKAKQRPQEDRGELVEFKVLASSTERVEVVARGTVVPARQVILSPEVGGRVVSMSESLVPGGLLAAGDTALRVDARDYRLALEQQRAAVNRAETELTIERSRKSVAEKEWEKFGSKRGGTASPLAKREPQLKSAEVAVRSAESGLKQAKLRVSRTTVRAPFNGIIQSRQVEMGQVVAPGTPVATLVGTDAYWVQVSVPVSQLSWFAIPGIGGGKEGAEVEVRQKLGTVVQSRKGRVVRLLGEVDPAGRMARVLVEIPNPLLTNEVVVVGTEEQASAGATIPLLLGSYVEVAITAREVDGVFAVPRSAIHEGTKALVMSDDSKLEIRDVEVLWSKPDTVLIGGGLKNGDKLITSQIAAPVAGMMLRVAGDAPKKPAPKKHALEKEGESPTPPAKPASATKAAAPSGASE